jgi:hypothetical protein
MMSQRVAQGGEFLPKVANVDWAQHPASLLMKIMAI